MLKIYFQCIFENLPIENTKPLFYFKTQQHKIKYRTIFFYSRSGIKFEAILKLTIMKDILLEISLKIS